MEQRVQLQPAYLLHRRPFRNTSLLVDIFTLDHGLVRLVARGARRAAARHRPLLQPFQPLLASFAGRGELRTLTGLESAAGGIRLRGRRLFSGLYVNELLARLLHHHDEQRALFQAYRHTLLALQGALPEATRLAAGRAAGTRPDDRCAVRRRTEQEAAARTGEGAATQLDTDGEGVAEPVAGPWASGTPEPDLELALRRFEITLLAELGYGIDFNGDCDTREPLRPTATYRYAPDSGFHLVHRDGEPAESLFLGEQLLGLRDGRLDEAATARAAKRLLRLALASRLGSRPLHSRGLFGTVLGSNGRQRLAGDEE